MGCKKCGRQYDAPIPHETGVDMTDEPDTVRAAWALFAERVLRPDSTPAQRRAAQITFYSGAFALIKMMFAAGHGQDGDPLDRAIHAAAKTAEWGIELNEFMAECQRQAAEMN